MIMKPIISTTANTAATIAITFNFYPLWPPKLTSVNDTHFGLPEEVRGD